MQPVSRRRLHTYIANLLACAIVGLAAPAPAAAFVAADPPPAESTSVRTSSSTTAPPTHSYDDADSEQQSEGSSPALWILAGAIAGLAAIAAVLGRADKSPGH